MTMTPEGRLDARFSSPGATATDWATAGRQLAEAELYWITTVRQDGRPHVTPMIGVWHEGALWFCTGPDERKARNLIANPHVTVTTGVNDLHEGLDLVVEGDARRMTATAALEAVANEYTLKYGSDWRFTVGDGAFLGRGGVAVVFAIAPDAVFAFGKGPFSQTKWQFTNGVPQ